MGLDAGGSDGQTWQVSMFLRRVGEVGLLIKPHRLYEVIRTDGTEVEQVESRMRV